MCNGHSKNDDPHDPCENGLLGWILLGKQKTQPNHKRKSRRILLFSNLQRGKNQSDYFPKLDIFHN